MVQTLLFCMHIDLIILTVLVNLVFLFQKILFRPEINIKPWETLLKDLKKGNEKIKWTDREPYAYWKGNPVVADTRMDLLKCNVSEKQDWSARVYAQVSCSAI